MSEDIYLQLITFVRLTQQTALLFELMNISFVQMLGKRPYVSYFLDETLQLTPYVLEFCTLIIAVTDFCVDKLNLKAHG